MDKRRRPALVSPPRPAAATPLTVSAVAKSAFAAVLTAAKIVSAAVSAAARIVLAAAAADGGAEAMAQRQASPKVFDFPWMIL